MMRHHKHYENIDDELLPEESYNDELNIEELEEKENQKLSKHKNARKSIEEYLEKKRIEKEYKDLFDDDYLSDE